MSGTPSSTIMSAFCILYFFAVATALAIGGTLAERAGPARGGRRWLWLTVIAASVVVPNVYWLFYSSDGWVIAGHILLPSTSAPHGAVAGGSDLFNWRYCALSPLGLTLMRYSAYATVGFAIWAFMSSVYVHRLLRRPPSGARVNDDAKRIEDRSILITDGVGPATVGVFRPRIVLPRWALGLSPAQLAYVIQHEDEHRRSQDTALLCVAGTLVALMPWNIPLWWQLRRLRLAIETDCDRRVVEALGNPEMYAQLLVRVAEAAHGRSLMQPALAGRHGMLEQRIRHLVDGVEHSRGVRVAALIGAALVAGLVLAAPHPMTGPAGTPAHSHAPPSTGGRNN